MVKTYLESINHETRIARKYSPSDFQKLKTILDSSFGVGYFNCEKLNSDNCLVADNGNPIGIIFGESDGTDVEVTTIAVKDSFRGQGIASQLLAKLIDEHSKLGILRFWSPAWVDGKHIPAAKLLEQAGFIPTATLKDYWMDDSIQRKYNCPTCGNPCRCSAIIFERLIHQNDKL